MPKKKETQESGPIKTFMKVRVTLTEEMLATKASDPELFKKFIASKHPEKEGAEDEKNTADAIAEEIETGKTIFHCSQTVHAPVKEGDPGVYNYQIKGHFKTACSAMRAADGALSKKLSNFRKVITEQIFISPRFIVFNLPEGKLGPDCERPAQGTGPRGPRTMLLSSETAPVGTTFEFEIMVFNKSYLPYIREWLTYGEFFGYGAWRNGGKGTFTWEELTQ